MKNLSLKMKILFGIEAIVSARILLFTIPVIISEKASAEPFPYSIEDRLILTLTYISALYLVIGISSFAGHKLWKLFHYLAAGVGLFLTSYLLKSVNELGGEAGIIHYAPVGFILFVTICVALSKAQAGGAAGSGENWKSILVVDDDETLHKTIRPILLQQGYSVLTAIDGEAGFEIAVKQQPSLIILDVIMPGIKGRDLCKKIKSEPQTKDIPVVFLTAKYSEDDIKAELEAGAEAHLTKPIEREALVSTISKILKSK